MLERLISAVRRHVPDIELSHLGLACCAPESRKRGPRQSPYRGPREKGWGLRGVGESPGVSHWVLSEPNSRALSGRRCFIESFLPIPHSKTCPGPRHDRARPAFALSSGCQGKTKTRWPIVPASDSYQCGKLLLTFLYTLYRAHFLDHGGN